MADKKIGEVFHTNNTNKFRHLMHNREVENRVPRVKKSIEENGWVQQPIICNEKYEVIDGQARLQACKEMGIGITYVVIPGLTIKDCRIINSISSNWRRIDRINSFSSEGNINYKYLEQIVKKLKDKTGSAESCTILRMLTNDPSIDRKIDKGIAQIDIDTYNDACDAIDYISKFIPILKAADTKTSAMLEAILFARKNLDESQRDSLLKAFEKRCSKDLINPRPISFEHAIRIVDDIYNYKKSYSNRISVEGIYKTQGKFKRKGETKK